VVAVVGGRNNAESELKKFEGLRSLKTPLIAMRAGATLSIERALKLGQTRLKLHGIAKPN
jgi:hypothetical protein